MVSDNFKRVEFENMPQLNLSNTNNLASGIQADIEERNKRMQQNVEEIGSNRKRTQKAIEQTAYNTAETNVQLQKVVENQNSYNG